MKGVVKLKYPIAGNNTNGTINPLEYANKVAPFFGEQPFQQGNFIPTTPPFYNNYRCRFMADSIDDIFKDTNKKNWFFSVFPKQKEAFRHKLEMVTKMRMNIFTPNKIKGGAPNAFTSLKFTSWFNVTERMGVGLDLDWDFMDDETGVEMYFYFLGGMAASMDLQIKVDVYTRLNQCTDQWAAWRMEGEDEMKALIEVLGVYKENFNLIHEEPIWSFQKINVSVDKMELVASLNESEMWIVSDEVNTGLILHPGNSLNSKTGQYKLDGDGAINHIEGMKDITTIAGRPVAIQRVMPLGPKQLYDPTATPMHLGHYYILPHGFHGISQKHKNTLRRLNLHCGEADDMTELTYEGLVARGLTLLKSVPDKDGFKTIFPNAPFLAGNAYLWKNDNPTIRKAHRLHCYGTFQGFLREKTGVDETKESLYYHNLPYSESNPGPDWMAAFVFLNRVSALTPALTKVVLSSDESKKNFYALPPDQGLSQSTYLIARTAISSQNVPESKYMTSDVMSHVNYLEKIFKLCKKLVILPPVPKDLAFKSETGPLDTTITVPKTDDMGMFFDLMLNCSKGSQLVGIHPELQAGIAAQKYKVYGVVGSISNTGVVTMGTLGAVGNSKYVPTLIPWGPELSGVKFPATIGTDQISAFIPITMTTDVTTPLFVADEKVEYYLNYCQYLYAHLDIGEEGEKLADIIKLNIEPGLGIEVSLPNECILGSNGWRLRTNGRSMAYAEQATEVIINDNSKTRKHEINLEKETGVVMKDPFSITCVKGMAALGRLYGDVVLDGLDKHSFWETLDQLKLTRRRSIAEYQDEKSIYVFFIDPLYNGGGIEVLTSHNAVSAYHIKDGLDLYKSSFQSVFNPKAYPNQITQAPENELMEITAPRNCVQFPGPCQKPDLMTGKWVDYKGKGWWGSASANCGLVRYGKNKKIEKK